MLATLMFSTCPAVGGSAMYNVLLIILSIILFIIHCTEVTLSMYRVFWRNVLKDMIEDFAVKVFLSIL